MRAFLSENARIKGTYLQTDAARRFRVGHGWKKGSRQTWRTRGTRYAALRRSRVVRRDRRSRLQDDLSGAVCARAEGPARHAGYRSRVFGLDARASEAARHGQ